MPHETRQDTSAAVVHFSSEAVLGRLCMERIVILVAGSFTKIVHGPLILSNRDEKALLYYREMLQVLGGVV